MNDDFKRKKVITKVLTLGSSILLFGLMITHISSLLSSEVAVRTGVSLYLIPSLLIGHVVLYIMIRKNMITVVSFALSALYISGSIYGAYEWGISMPSALLIFSLVISIIGILFSSKMALWSTLITCLLILLLGIREINNPDITSWKKYGLDIVDLISYIVIICIGSGLTFLSNKEIEKSLRRALESEKDLESKVEERTAELKRSQLETISSMSQTYELGKIAQGLFHDLITPLSTVSMYVSEYEKTNTKKYIDKAVEASRRMSRILEVTKNQIRNKEEMSSFSAVEEINISIDLMQYYARKRAVLMNFDIKNDLILHGLPIRFDQIISNIIQNAIESFENTGDNRITILLEDKKIVIKNNGPQIPQDILSKIFKSQITTKQNHFGIGLPTIAKIIKEDFSGEISVESLIKETIFTLHFPNAKIN